MSLITIAGGHGKIARHLTTLLSDGDHEVHNLIRTPGQAEDIRGWGGTPVHCNLENATVRELMQAIEGSDAVVFAAGAGGGSGAERKESVDYGAAVKLVRACEKTGIKRYVMVSSMGTDDPPEGEDIFEVYLRAKARADRELMDSNLDWTIVRPGALTDGEGTGKVTIGRHVDSGEIPRQDVAAVLAAVLGRPQTCGLLFEVVTGDVSISQALTP